MRAADALSTPPVTSLVLLRHGVSMANEGRLFGGWDDVPLSETGVRQAIRAGEWLRESGFSFDSAYSSVLSRAITTAWHCLDALGQTWLPLHKDWRLNERHDGALQGHGKVDAAMRHGAEQVRLWRRGFRSTPPALTAGDPRDAWGDLRYRGLRRDEVPLTESLHDTARRVSACWHETILPGIVRGHNTLVVAHGNSIRALMTTLEGIGEACIPAVEVPNGVPLVYSFDSAAGVFTRRAAIDDWQ